MKRFSVTKLITFLLLLCAVSVAGAAQTFTVDEALKVRRVGDPQLAPDGRTVAFTITDIDKTANRGTTQIYLINIDGTNLRQLTKETRSSSAPRWSPDGKRLAFVSGGQIYLMDMSASSMTGGMNNMNAAPRKVTNISSGASDPVWSPDGMMLAFISDIYPQCNDDACNARLAKEAEDGKVKAVEAERLLYRHWTEFKRGKRTHVFVVETSGAATNVAHDMTPGDYDAPPFSLGGQTDYAFSPDSKELAFARNTDLDEALSTNGDIWTVPLAGTQAKRITEANKGADLSPMYSPDGRFIAYRSQATARFESDRWRLMLYDRQANTSRSVTETIDNNVDSYSFTRDGKKILFAVGERGRNMIYEYDMASGAIKRLLADGVNDDARLTPDGKTMIFTRNTAQRATEIYRANADGTNVQPLTKINDAFFARFRLQPAEEMSWTGAADTKISGWMVKPPDFDQSKKYPLLVLVHGGPQGASNDGWSFRWNPQIFANAGYVVFMPNPRGSTGYGQQLTNEISGDWGGKVYDDIMNGVQMVAAMSFIDKDRIGAAGGSYGGYMVNWMLGHNNDPRAKFKAFASHAGVYNLTSMYGATEELWFTEWEFKGNPWDNPELYMKWSPHMFAKNFNTPTLVIHGELDYRVPIGEGLQLYTALQRKGVPSKLLYYPDEGHWILKPQNSALWYKNVIGWFDKYVKVDGARASE